jgi:alkanesulfonate monooxygenase SsuD/methylene tetrahydromethanopterin reductase-like flavin-dependent oxidoreductase (luciferase family)
LMWSEAHPRFHGTYFQIDDAAATPRPSVIPPICIGSSGDKIGLPIVGRRADMWNTFYPGFALWKGKRAIVDAAAIDGGRDPADIESCVTLSGDLPESDAASEKWLERLTRLSELGISHFVMDFGHPLDAEPALRFAEQVIAPIKSA